MVRSQRNNRKTRKWTTPKRVRFVQIIAPTLLSHGRRIKIEQINNQQTILDDLPVKLILFLFDRFNLYFELHEKKIKIFYLKKNQKVEFAVICM